MQANTYKIQIKGLVQGVGFRPFVYNLATQNKLTGNVSNNANGVVIHINTTEKKIDAFVQQILNQKPKVSVITSYNINKITPKIYIDFSIVLSEVNHQIQSPLTPDFSVCNSCKEELKDKKNRRFQYAFTTCVQCGPRYSITTKFPFEREHTSLSKFKMCNTCKKEYNNPEDKRFHSQTNSCSTCGIKLQFKNDKGDLLEENQQTILLKIAKKLKEGNIIAIKNTNGYLLCCDATNTKVIQKLRKNKKRPNKPFAVLYSNIETLKKDFELSDTQEKLINSNIAPIVILKNKTNTIIKTDIIAPKLHQTGVMLPSSSLFELIMKTVKTPLVATSGNIHGSSIISNEKEAQEELKNVADYFIHHNLDIQFPQDDSVLKIIDKQTIILRRSRGLAPNYIDVNAKTTEPILAMGAHLKSTFTFSPNTHIYVSQYFGNLDSYNVLQRYKKTINDYIQLFNATPKTILIDTHPNYQSSVIGKEFALKWNTNLIVVQHHKAHFASVLGEHHLFSSKDQILGVIWDGTGLGDDNNIWGGEFFTYQNKKMKRLTHFNYFNWIANDKMAKEPRLALLSLMSNENKQLIENKFSKTEWSVYNKMLASNKLKTSSVGRLFDAVASLLINTDINTYEAEAVMLLEQLASEYQQKSYLNFLENEKQLSPQKIIENIIKAKENNIPKEKIAASFIYTLSKCILKISKKENIKIIACSGGVFQNSFLVKMLLKMTKEENINLKINCKLSPNDENISFGQLMYNQYCKN
ncbi:carbamoyltransferase HypF [Polaribacter sp. MSW13]|uniref:Carbamoyltransferase n=1 Tax=Polaribacter marinus TaxID=2916838 RepID=A0A9X1VLB2_9FLAO|nr:carbamoyltransferase HypF [Polaribacter marinus]MCI2228246.1 carbamoyltransferase HypF [Polaribacter marinus]